MSRRQFLKSSVALAAAPIFPGIGEGQSTNVSSRPVGAYAQAIAQDYSPAVQSFRAEVGETSFAELLVRLRKTNSDIKTKGLKTIRGVASASGTFLTGYPYTEFYDWDIYFENLYLAYYGVFPYCYTNLKEFLARQSAAWPDFRPRGVSFTNTRCTKPTASGWK